MKSFYSFIASSACQKQDMVVTTIIASEGSTPQKSGISAVFSNKGLEYGTIGGGILEENVKKIAMNFIRTKMSGIYHFELNQDISDHEGAICGGRVTVLIDTDVCNNNSFIELLAETAQQRIPYIVISTIYPESGNNIRIERYIATHNSGENLPLKYRAALTEEVVRLFDNLPESSFSSLILETLPDGKKVTAIFETVFPPPALIIAGAGHIGKALSHLGNFLGFEVTVIDDRKEFANKTNLPDADVVILDNIGNALEKIKKNNNTYIVIVTRGHAGDAEALRKCIGSEAAYIGMIGSKSKIEKMHHDFITKNWATEIQWSKIHAPVGLKINSKSVEEIAVSIAAELIMVKNRGH